MATVVTELPLEQTLQEKNICKPEKLQTDKSSTLYLLDSNLYSQHSFVFQFFSFWNSVFYSNGSFSERFLHVFD